eukprot:5948094-Pleurochrysis_carterae.AAC.1
MATAGDEPLRACRAQELPADILVARCVRPMREALERVFKLLFAGGSSDHVAAIQVVRRVYQIASRAQDRVSHVAWLLRPKTALSQICWTQRCTRLVCVG